MYEIIIENYDIITRIRNTFILTPIMVLPEYVNIIAGRTPGLHSRNYILEHLLLLQ